MYFLNTTYFTNENLTQFKIKNELVMIIYHSKDFNSINTFNLIKELPIDIYVLDVYKNNLNYDPIKYVPSLCIFNNGTIKSLFTGNNTNIEDIVEYISTLEITF